MEVFSSRLSVAAQERAGRRKAEEECSLCHFHTSMWKDGGKCFNTKPSAGSSQNGSHTKKMNLQQITDFE